MAKNLRGSALTDVRVRVDDLRRDLHHAERIVAEERAKLAKAEVGLVAAEEAQKVVQVVAQTVQQTAHGRIATVVSRCLEAVFDRPYQFKITFERKRGRTEAVLTFVRDGMELDPVSASGGGCLDVAAFGLRLASVLLTRPAPRRLLVLDEPFRCVSRNHAPRLAVLLEQLAEELDLQIIMVTHNEELVCGTVIRIEK